MQVLSLFTVQTQIILGLFSLIFLTLLYFWYAYRKEKQLVSAEEKTLSSYVKIIQRANEHARTLIAKASQKAQQILTTSTYIKKTAQKEIKTSIDTNTDTLLTTYETSLHEVKNEGVATLRELALQLEKMTAKELASYGESLEKELLATKMQLATYRAQELQKVRETVEEYKKTELEQARASIEGRIQEIAEKLLGKTITLEDHETLIVEAIDQAKKNNIF